MQTTLKSGAKRVFFLDSSSGTNAGMTMDGSRSSNSDMPRLASGHRQSIPMLKGKGSRFMIRYVGPPSAMDATSAAAQCLFGNAAMSSIHIMSRQARPMPARLQATKSNARGNAVSSV